MTLSKTFKPKFQYYLQRLGNQCDGGYLVGLNTIKKSKFLISYGIRDDWSFEKDFIKINKKIKVYAYDDQLSFFFLQKKIITNFIKIFIPGYKSSFLKSILNIYEYFFFFRKLYRRKKIIPGDTLKISKDLSCIFFKIDIEKSEYKILGELIKIKEKINGIIIEFHQINENFHKIKNFIQKINLKVTHIHPNNYGGVNYNSNPNILEITFENKPRFKNYKVSFPHPLDRANSSYLDDIILNFKK